MNRAAPEQTPEIDPVRLALYRANGMSMTCFFCFCLLSDGSAGSSRVNLVQPAGLPRDVQTAIDGFKDGDGRVALCSWCAQIAGVGDMERILSALLDRIIDSGWFQSLPSDQQNAALGLFSLTQYVWWHRHQADPPPPAPGLRFFFDLVRESTLKPAPGNTHGVFEIFNRDLGLGCYAVTVPAADKVQVLDIASRDRGKGYGAIALRKLCSLADRHGVTLTGVIEPHDKYGGRRGALSAGQLRRWYDRFGFQVTGRHEGRECVERRPTRNGRQS